MYRDVYAKLAYEEIYGKTHDPLDKYRIPELCTKIIPHSNKK